ncbi:Cof-type HAD-IIB family hydrolase [Collinsella sp. An2]|uniref:Cof-type HAD-IIB family hydrolase n=1 Tax=Collinsella sp. An2 TaxID=1965585 RepID=UPI000B38232F|nr:Cof-type HAD-IIB family hydrolase [Collinsella sp. An2]OUP09450.1 HAD family hydrolase [Collinsella sp. An2]
MSDRKIIFLDVDGTIVTYDNELPESAARAIRQARANGHKVLMCTGRSKGEVSPELEALGFDGMLGGNGAYVEVEGREVMHQHISAEQCRKIVDWCHERGLAFYLESNNGLFASENFREDGHEAVVAYSQGAGAPVPADVTVEDVFPLLQFGCELYRDDVNKVSFVLRSYDDYLDARRDFSDMKVGTWGGKGEHALFGDFGVRGIDKARAVRVAVDALGADMADTIAMGDAKVDVPMLQACAVGVAMGSGGEEAKAAADYVTTAVDDDGLWNAFEHLGLL